MNFEEVVQGRRSIRGFLKKPVPKAFSFGSAFNNPRNIRNHKRAAMIDAHDAQARRERGEWIVSDLWLGGANRTHQRRFACVGIAK